jgi:hypothetical protein
LNLPGGQADQRARLIASHVRMLVEQQHKAKALYGLDRHRPPMHRVDRLLQKFFGEGTSNQLWSWHSGFLSLPGMFGSSAPFTKNLPQLRRYL